MSKQWLSSMNPHTHHDELFYTAIKEYAKKALNFFQQETRRELRYTFRGKIVPIEIENVLKHILKRSLRNEQFDQFYDPQLGRKLTIQEFEKSKKADGRYVYFIKVSIEWQAEPFSFAVKEIIDRERWRYPLWEIYYKDNVYREIPRHGNVFSHSRYQQEHIEKSTDMDYRDNKMSLEQKQLIDSVHPIHDIDEIEKWDVEDLKKSTVDYNDDGTLLALLHQTIDREDKTAEQHITALYNMLSRIDGPSSIFKAYERIQYFKNALDIFQTAWYYNHKEVLAADILANYMPRFLANKPEVYLPFTWLQADIDSHQPIAHRLLSFPSIRSFFHNNKKDISAVFYDTLKKYPNSGDPIIHLDQRKHIEDGFQARKLLQKQLDIKDYR